MKKYVVVGGQYQHVVYGDFDSLLSAKRCATKHEEYWDNWQGWHKPDIYDSDDCNEDGYPNWNTAPLYTWDAYDNRWIPRKAFFDYVVSHLD